MASDHSATTHTSTEHPSEHKSGFPPFESHTFASQLIWLAISFGLLYYLMAKIALPRIEGILRERSQRLAKDLDEAHAMKVEADKAAEAYERSLRDAQAKANAIVQEARNKLAAEAEARRKTQEAELSDKLAASDATITRRTAEAMGNVRAIAGETAASIVQRLTGKSPDPATIDRALNALKVN